MNFWGRRDPRAKVFAALVLSFAIAVAPLSRILMVLPLVLVLLATTGLGRAGWWIVLRATLILWFLSFLANAFLVPGVRVGPDVLGFFRPTEEGLSLGFAHGAKLAALTVLSAWVAGSTQALDVARSLEWGVRGHQGLRRAVHRTVFPVVLALRMIPLFTQEAQRLLDVDRLRGGPRHGIGGVRRIARLAPAWMATVLDRGEAMALALTLRGYRPGVDRGFAEEYRPGVPDVGILVMTVGAAVYLGTG